LPNEIAKIVGFLARWQDDLAGVVVESTYNWYWLVDYYGDSALNLTISLVHCHRNQGAVQCTKMALAQDY
jgi:hypothetical protein